MTMNARIPKMDHEPSEKEGQSPDTGHSGRKPEQSKKGGNQPANAGVILNIVALVVYLVYAYAKTDDVNTKVTTTTQSASPELPPLNQPGPGQALSEDEFTTIKNIVAERNRLVLAADSSDWRMVTAADTYHSSKKILDEMLPDYYCKSSGISLADCQKRADRFWSELLRRDAQAKKDKEAADAAEHQRLVKLGYLPDVEALAAKADAASAATIQQASFGLPSAKNVGQLLKEHYPNANIETGWKLEKADPPTKVVSWTSPDNKVFSWENIRELDKDEAYWKAGWEPRSEPAREIFKEATGAKYFSSLGGAMGDIKQLKESRGFKSLMKSISARHLSAKYDQYGHLIIKLHKGEIDAFVDGDGLFITVDSEELYTKHLDWFVETLLTSLIPEGNWALFCKMQLPGLKEKWNRGSSAYTDFHMIPYPFWTRFRVWSAREGVYGGQEPFKLELK